jgi:predicted ATPase
MDVTRFLQTVEARDLDAAVAHYAGDLLPGFTCDSLAFEEWLRLERERLHQLALEAMFEAAQDHLAAGRLDKAQGLARRQLALEPWREPAHRQLMQAHALAGDRAAALAQYETCRALLWEELAVEPAPETTALREAITAGRYGPVATNETIRPPRPRRHNLPADLTPFIGREHELEQIDHLLTAERQRLVTIVGPGGMGKTRLALAVGAALRERYEDGVYFVDLTPLSRAADIPQAIAIALSYQAPDRAVALEPQLLAALNHQQLLLILDNFEHLLDGATLVSAMLQACPRLSVLATSRERLNLAGESRYELGGLEFPDEVSVEDALTYTAVQLFVASGRRARPGFAVTPANVTDVTHICRQVQGMPLALVLAAAWLELLTPAEIAAEIAHGLDFLAVELGDLPARQRSLHAVFDCTWQMMPPEGRAIMATLSVFHGGFSRDAAEQVAGANLRLLLTLANQSLLQRRPDGRFTMHELLRQFAAARRRESRGSEEAELAHACYFARLVKTELDRLRDDAPVYVPERLAGDAENIYRAWFYAIDHGLVDVAAALSGGLYALANAQGVQAETFFREGLRALVLQGVAETHPAMLRLRLIALLSLEGVRVASAITGVYLDFLPLAERHAAPELLLWLYCFLSDTCRWSEDPQALIWAERAADVARAQQDELALVIAAAQADIARVTLRLSEPDTRSRLERHLIYLEATPAPSRMVFEVLEALQQETLARRDFEQSLIYGRRMQNMAKGFRNMYGISVAGYGLADTCLRLGRPAQAAGHLLDVLDWHLAIARVWQTLGCLMSICMFAEPLGYEDEAAPVLAMAYHHPEALPRIREEFDAVRRRLQAALGAEAFAAAWKRGKILDYDTAIAQIRAALLALAQA